MKLNLTDVKANRVCQKPGCGNRLVYRHHRGGEHTFVRHFRHMALWPEAKQDYARFCLRYHAFRDEDIVYVCGDHHEEVHDGMEQFDLDWMVEHSCIHAFGAFTWDEAMDLIEARKIFTDTWLKVKTPGLKTRKFTGRP
jgi:hypothetical protein